MKKYILLISKFKNIPLTCLIFILITINLNTYAQEPAKFTAEKIPFWQHSAGYWLNQNTYLDANLEYKIKRYHSILAIQLEDDKIITTEYKFFPQSKLFSDILGSDIPNDTGVQMNKVTTMTIINEMGQAKSDSSINGQKNLLTLVTPFNQDSALLNVTSENATTDIYRVLITYPTKETRIVVNLGIQTPNNENPTGGLRGASIFNGIRINKNQLEQIEQRLRIEYNVAAVLTTDDKGQISTEILAPLYQQ